MLKPFSRTLLALALLSPLTVQAQQDDAARQKELEAARTDLRRAAQRVAELSRGTDTLRAPIRIDRVVAGRPRLGVLLAGDDEGVRTRARKVVEAGVTQGYFLSSYSARKLGMKTTGHAGGSQNLHLRSRLTAAGDNLDEMLRKLHRGLFVVELMGQGVNYVTGDYSRGAAGFWVENGRIVHPVEEVTIAGHLGEMFKGIVAVGADEYTMGSKTIGSVLVDKMMVAGS